MNEPAKHPRLRLRYSDLTEADRKRICNGCGAKGGWLKVPDFFFEADCDHHDFHYWRGGTWAERKKADRQFLAHMLRDAKYGAWHSRFSTASICTRLVDPTRPRPVLQRLGYSLLAYAYYLAVRAFGADAWNLGTPKDRIDLHFLRVMWKDQEFRRAARLDF